MGRRSLLLPIGLVLLLAACATGPSATNTPSSPTTTSPDAGGAQQTSAQPQGSTEQGAGTAKGSRTASAKKEGRASKSASAQQAAEAKRTERKKQKKKDSSKSTTASAKSGAAKGTPAPGGSGQGEGESQSSTTDEGIDPVQNESVQMAVNRANQLFLSSVMGGEQRGADGGGVRRDEAVRGARAAKARRKAYPPPQLEQIKIGPASLEMVRLSGGEFLMGEADGNRDAEPRHPVTLAPFAIGRYEVTQRQWETVMGNNPSHFKGCADCPVDSVSWNDTQRFIQRLNELTGRQFRLPSEAEWEFSCRAGGNDPYCGDEEEPTLLFWHAANSEGRSQQAGLLLPNAFGLHDMSGNLYEWVDDCWHDGYQGAPGDGSAWVSEGCSRRVLRGGAWYYTAPYAGSTFRNANTPYTNFVIYGFRLALDL